jgi:starch-binding outer membrane protein, SusD/RagB family
MNPRTCKALASAAALLFVAAAGCTDPTVQPVSTITSANIFNDPSSYQKFLAKLYAGLAVGGQSSGDGRTDIQGIDGGFSQYLRLYWEMEELPTDEAVLAWGDVGIPDMNTQTWNAFNVFPQSMYYRVMFQVTLANEFLRQTTDAALASRGVSSALKATIQQYRAEARFLRALSYWHGIDLFGDIPLVTENDLIGTPPAQSTRAIIYAYIVSELTAIQSELPAAVPANYGRATGPGASMLLAEVYLNAGVYTGTSAYGQALAAAQAVISSGAYSLDPSYRHLFQADNNTSPEIIFAITQDGLRTQTYGGVNFIIHASCGNSLDKSVVGVDGCWYGNRLKPEAYLRYDAVNDTRASFIYTTGQTLAVASISSFGAGYLAPKFQNVTSTGQPGSNPGFVDTDFPMFRLGETYLIYAEAFLRGGGGTQAQALTYVNALRERAYGNTSGDITAPQLTLQFILDERGRELLWEAHRRTDLVRYGQFTGGTYIWSWKGGTQAGIATDSHLDLFPIPATELVANPKLKQNPGY